MSVIKDCFKEVYMPKQAKCLGLFALILLANALFAMVPPAPGYEGFPPGWHQAGAERFMPYYEADGSPKGRNLPNNILVLMVEFSDVHFKLTPQYPDFVAHDQVFFERWMLHLQDFFYDASHGKYELGYTVHPIQLRLPKPMHFYGTDTAEKTDANLPQILADLMPLCTDINFSAYDGLIIFHSGAGQETDVAKTRKESIWSTYLTRKTLQYYFDEDNDDYLGFITPDGAILTNVVIVPEDEYHDYFPAQGEENDSLYLFSLYGVLAHQFGHVLGLPTLFDNVSSNGRSQGIGHWGLMGTGVWNASGYVPAQLSAWCRYYLGWEEAVLVNEDSSDLPLDCFLNHDEDAIRLYKVPISEKEYFLIENRQQNPDGSRDPYNNLPSYSFKLLPEGQEYYEDFPLLPKFDFMTNRYTGCEWDFFLPGFGNSPLTDGSGILIWHVDEHIIEENFSANFDLNRVNGDAKHKGVDLEEADGIQHLDTDNFSYDMYGSYLDSFRSGHNDYFGNDFYQGMVWQPTAASYYGGVPLEVYDISESANRMYFSVRFRWRLTAGYEEESKLPAAVIDFFGDGEEVIFYPMPNGKLAMFKDDRMVDGYPQKYSDIPRLYSWDGEYLYIPQQVQSLARLMKKSKDKVRYANMPGYIWLSHPVDIGQMLALPMYNEALGESHLFLYDKISEKLEPQPFTLPHQLKGNLSFTGEELYMVSDGGEDNTLLLWQLEPLSGIAESFATSVPADSTVVSLFTVIFKDQPSLLLQLSSSVYLFDKTDAGYELKAGFPYVMDSKSTAALSLADFDGNGILDIIIGTSNGVQLIDFYGNRLSPVEVSAGLMDDNFSSGVLVADLDGDGKLELASALNFNRLGVWEENFQMKRGFPVSFSTRGRHIPFVVKGADGGYYLRIASDKGSLYQEALPHYDPSVEQKGWCYEYADLKRTAFIDGSDLQNKYLRDSVFVKDELYVFPNPLKSFYEQKVRLSVMPTKDLEVSLKVYDIAGKMVYQDKGFAKQYLHNIELFNIPVDKLSAGVYIAVVSGSGESHRLRFAIEK